MQQLPVRLITIPFRRIPSWLAVAGQPADSATRHHALSCALSVQISDSGQAES